MSIFAVYNIIKSMKNKEEEAQSEANEQQGTRTML